MTTERDSRVGHPRSAPWRRWGIRQQLTWAATLAVTIPLVLGVFVLATLLHRSLVTSLQAGAADEAHRLAALVFTNGPDIVGAPDEVDDPFKAQVMDASGRVLASSSAKLTTPLASLDPAPGELLTSGASPVWLPGDAAVTDLRGGRRHHPLRTAPRGARGGAADRPA